MNLSDEITLTRLELATCMLMFSIDVLDDYTNKPKKVKDAVLRSCYADTVAVAKEPGLTDHIQGQVESVRRLHPELS